MSIKVMDKVWSDSAQKGSALLLLLAIADHAADDGYCWPKTETLAEKIRMSVRTVYRLVDAVEADGELYVVRTNRNNRYVVTLGMSGKELIDVLRTRKEDDAIGDILSRKDEGDKMTRDMGVTSIGDMGVTSKVTQLCHPNRQEPSVNRHEGADFFPARDSPGGNGSKERDQDKSILEYDDPLSMAAEIRRRRGDVPDWAVRDATGPDPYYPALLAFCTLTQRAPPVTEDQGIDWLDTLADAAVFLGISAKELREAIALMAQGDRFEWYLHRGVWSSPHSNSFQEKLDQVVGEMRAGTIDASDTIRVGR